MDLMLVYLLCLALISSDLLIAMHAKQWRGAQITKCLCNKVAIHKGGKSVVVLFGRAASSQAHSSNPTCNFSLSESISFLYSGIIDSANMNCCVQDHRFQTYMLTVTLCHNGWHWPNLVTLCHIMMLSYSYQCCLMTHVWPHACPFI